MNDLDKSFKDFVQGRISKDDYEYHAKRHLFKVGLRVVAKEDASPIRKGKEGTIRAIHGSGSIGVEWDYDHRNFWNLDGIIDTKRGWYTPMHFLDLKE